MTRHLVVSATGIFWGAALPMTAALGSRRRPGLMQSNALVLGELSHSCLGI